MSTRLKFIPIAVCLALGLAACGDDKKSEDTTAAPTTTAAATDTTVAPETSATDAATTVPATPVKPDVMLADSSLGEILVDGDGMTLYLFANDPPDTSTCTGGCASTWPPLLADESLEVGPGLDPSLFVTVAGEGGQVLSFFGHPLYYYASDTAPGDTNGNGVGGVWFAIGADGDPVT